MNSWHEQMQPFWSSLHLSFGIAMAFGNANTTVTKTWDSSHTLDAWHVKGAHPPQSCASSYHWPSAPGICEGLPGLGLNMMTTNTQNNRLRELFNELILSSRNWKCTEYYWESTCTRLRPTLRFQDLIVHSALHGCHALFFKFIWHAMCFGRTAPFWTKYVLKLCACSPTKFNQSNQIQL